MSLITSISVTIVYSYYIYLVSIRKLFHFRMKTRY